jgi:Homeodomain-like domain
MWLLSLDYKTKEVAEILSFSPRWAQRLVKRYNEHGPDSVGDRRLSNGEAPTILTADALVSLERAVQDAAR